MGALIINNQAVFVDGYDLTGRSNSVALKYSSEPKDATVLQDGTRKRLGGLKEVMANYEGFVCYDDIDAALFNSLAISDNLFSVCVEGETFGSKVYFFNSLLTNFAPGATIGELLKFSAEAEASGTPLIAGRLLLDSKAAPITANGNGTGYQLGAITTGKKLYAGIHIIECTDIIDLILERDDNSNFTSAETVFTFDQFDDVIGSDFKTSSSTSANDYYRFAYTVSGSSPSIKAIGVVGIL